MAFEWYMKAAEQGDVYGCFNVGECYYHGKGVEQNAEQAFEWYMRAADKGDMQSQVNVANAYYLGNGTEQDHHKAFLWYREAAFQGHILSQKNVGAAYWNGDGVEKSLEECGYPPRDYQSRGLLPSGMSLPPTVAMPRHSLPLAGS